MNQTTGKVLRYSSQLFSIAGMDIVRESSDCVVYLFQTPRNAVNSYGSVVRLVESSVGRKNNYNETKT